MSGRCDMGAMMTTRRACLRGLGAACLGALSLPLQSAPLARVRERGTLSVGIYHNMPPFHVNGKGIDVDIAQALAEALEVKLALLPFHADDSMNDDLRNMVWRGHYLGYGPADVLLHVPVDRPLMDANPQVTIFGPYCRERVAIARRLEQVPQLLTLSQLAGRKVAVPGQSLAGWLLLGAEDGALRQDLVTHWKDGAEAARALQRGEFVAAGGLASELESVLHGDERFAISELPSPGVSRQGWAVGMAVKRDAAGLAEELQRALDALAASGRLREIFARGNLAWSAA